MKKDNKTETLTEKLNDQLIKNILECLSYWEFVFKDRIILEKHINLENENRPED